METTLKCKGCGKFIRFDPYDDLCQECWNKLSDILQNVDIKGKPIFPEEAD